MIRISVQNRIWLIGFRVTSSFVQVVISQNELKLLGSVEKWITLSDSAMALDDCSIIYPKEGPSVVF